MVLFKAAILGAMCGLSVGVLNARMYFAPEVMSAGAFRTIAELNACGNDPLSHFTFGVSYFLSTFTTHLSQGTLSQDFLHRTVPNVGLSILLLKNKKLEETLYHPIKMGIVCCAVCTVLYVVLCGTASLVPAFVTDKMMTIFTPTADYLLIIMQVLYLVACFENGIYTAVAGLVMGAVAYLATGNCTAGCILGILTGKTIENNGLKSKTSIIFITLMAVVWGYIFYARGALTNCINAFKTLSEIFTK